MGGHTKYETALWRKMATVIWKSVQKTQRSFEWKLLGRSYSTELLLIRIRMNPQWSPGSGFRSEEIDHNLQINLFSRLRTGFCTYRYLVTICFMTYFLRKIYFSTFGDGKVLPYQKPDPHSMDPWSRIRIRIEVKSCIWIRFETNAVTSHWTEGR
jgi:hypothetical protein